MDGWKLVCKELIKGDKNLASIRDMASNNFESWKVFPLSIHNIEGSYVFIARVEEKKVLVAFGEGTTFHELDGLQMNIDVGQVKICDLTNDNCDVLRRYLPFMNPSNHKGKDISIGLGDRLGLASAGHIRLMRGKPVFPVLAQQSIRELNLTQRTYRDVLADAAWAVLQEGYQEGYGADGDHLKTADEVKMALEEGFTMITLDCSEHIDNQAASLSEAQIEAAYSSFQLDNREDLEKKYMDREFILKDGTKLVFKPSEFMKIVLIYQNAIKFTLDIYNSLIKNCGRGIDFEMSIDETLTSTTPESHFFVASQLIDGGVDITSLAPRFCGEFQKGIDYKGDIARFEEEFKIHVKIAQYFGYKVSIHSGSDKFSVFPIIGRETGGCYHLKTAGTNWLEAVRVIAACNPQLYRRMHKFALEKLEEAKKYYHISADVKNIPDIDKIKDDQLSNLMDEDDSRQVLHITYGLILTAKNDDGTPAFRNEIYSTLDKHETEYCESLEKHIGRHLEKLGVQ